MDMSSEPVLLTPELSELIGKLMAAGSHASPEAALRAALAGAETGAESQSERDLSGLIEGIGNGFYALDRDWRYTRINRAAELYFDRPRETMLGQVIWDLFPWSHGTELKARYERAMATGETASFEGTAVGVPGRQVEFHLFPFDGGLGVSFRDWTERNRAEEALRESEARLRLAVDAGRLAVWELDLASSRLKPSQELNDILGYPRDHVLDIEEIRTRYYPGDRERVQKAGQDALSSGERFFQAEYRFLRPDGMYRWLLLRAEILFTEGTPTSVVGVLLDINDRKQAEDALRESEARLGIATAAAELGIWDWNLATGEMVYSDRAKAISGLPLDEPVTLDAVRKATHPEDLPRTSDLARRSLDPALREKSPYEYRIVRPDGEVRWVLAHGEAVFATVDGKERAIRYVGTIQDITARVQADAALRESEARLSALADNLPLGMVYQVATSPDGSERQFLYLSGNCERVNGVPREAAIADAGALYSLVLPEHVDVLKQAEATAIREGRAFETEAAFRHARTGEVRWYRMISAARPLPNGWRVWDGIQIDITEHKRAEEAVRRSEERLRAIMDEMPVGVFLAGIPSGEIVFHNAKSAELLGHPMYPVPGVESMANYGGVHPDGRRFQAEDYPIARTVLTGAEIDQEEILYQRGDGNIVNLSISSAPMRGMSDSGGLAICVFHDVTERKRAEEHQVLLINELNHRVKNTLATVQSIAAQSFREAETSGDPSRIANARASFEARIFALARAHDVLTQENWEGAGLRDVVDKAVAPHRGGTDYHVFLTEGPDLRVPPQMALSISMALHELCTNAAKYGALTNRGGHVLIAWSEGPGPTGPHLRMRWEERGGPPVIPPSRKGFGTRLIERGLARELGGDVKLAYEPAGVVCTVDVPLPR